MKPCIELKHVSFQYPLADDPSITDINLSFEPHKFYAITGLNGSGKSTLASIIRGFIPTYVQGDFEGEVYYDGIPANEIDPNQLALDIGYVFQDPFNQISAVKDTVVEEIAFALENFGFSLDEINQRVDEALTKTNLTDIAFHHPFHLSGGQQQRLAIASALALHPKILIFDEPTSQIDSTGRKEIYQIIQTLKNEGVTILCIDHDADLMAQYSDEIIVLQDGKVRAKGSPQEIYTQEIEGIAYPSLTRLAKALQLPIPISLDQAISIFRRENVYDSN